MKRRSSIKHLSILCVAGLVLAAFVFGLTLFAKPNLSDDGDMMKAEADDENEDVKNVDNSYSYNSLTSGMVTTDTMYVHVSKVLKKSSYVKKYTSESKATVKVTVELSGDLATAVTNGRVTLTFGVGGQFVAKAWSEKNQTVHAYTKLSINYSGKEEDDYVYLKDAKSRDEGADYTPYEDTKNGKGFPDNYESFSDSDVTFTGVLNSTTIIFTLESYGSADIDGSWGVEAHTFAYACINSIKISIEDNTKANVKFSAQTGGSVTNSGDNLVGYDKTASSIATVDPGYMFDGWHGSCGDLVPSIFNVTSSQGYSIDSDGYSATAYFREIPVSDNYNNTSGSAAYYYDGNKHGPTISLPSTLSYNEDSYSIKNCYRLNGTGSYSDSYTPTTPGTYQFKGEVYYNGTLIGSTAVQTFTIQKSSVALQLTLNGEEQTLNASISDIYGFHIPQIGYVDSKTTNASSTNREQVAGTITWDDSVAVFAKYGTHTYSYTFRPTQADYYNEVKGSITITTSIGFSVTTEGVSMPALSERVRINAEELQLEENDTKAYVQLEATVTEEEGKTGYFFLGWIVGGEATTTYYSVDSTYRFEITDLETRTWVAVFGRVSGLFEINGADGNYTKSYTGSTLASDMNGLRVDPGERYAAGYRADEVKITRNGSEVNLNATAQVGTYALELPIYNTSEKLGGQTKVYTYKRTIVVERAKLQIAVDVNNSPGYSASTGWAQRFKVNISLPGVVGGGVEAYAYKVGDGPWTVVTTGIGDDLGCPLAFEPAPPASESGLSANSTYTFAALHRRNGDPDGDSIDGYYVVSNQDKDEESLKSYTLDAKTDTVVPTITVALYCGDVEQPEGDDVPVGLELYNGEWVNRTVWARFTLSYGGSGVYVYYDSDTVTGVRIQNSENKGNNTDLTTGKAVWVAFGRTEDITLSKVKFRAVTPTGKSAEFETDFEIHVDKTAPQIKANSVQQTTQWQQDADDFSLTFTDAGGSNLKRFTVERVAGRDTSSYSDDSFNGLEGESRVDGTIKIRDRAIYRVTVFDEAGNASAIYEIHELIDTTGAEVESVTGYTADTWTKGTPSERETVTGEPTAGQDEIEIYTERGNGTILLTITVLTGGSGVRVYYATREATTGGSGYGEEGEKQPIPNSSGLDYITEDYTVERGTYTFEITGEQNRSYVFYAVDAFGREKRHEFGAVKIDTTAPTLRFVTALSSYQGDNPWTAAAVVIRVNGNDSAASNASGSSAISGVDSLTVTTGGSDVATDGSSGSWSFTVDRASPYEVTLTDYAGNKTIEIFSLKIDQSDPVCTASRAYLGEGESVEYSFDGVWANVEKRLYFVISATFSPSGVFPAYSTDGGRNWISMVDWIQRNDNIQIVNGYVFEAGKRGEQVQKAEMTVRWNVTAQYEQVQFALFSASTRGNSDKAVRVVFGRDADAEFKVYSDFEAPQTSAVALSAPTLTEGLPNGDGRSADSYSRAPVSVYATVTDRGSDIDSVTARYFNFKITPDDVSGEWEHGEDAEGNLSEGRYTVAASQYGYYVLCVADKAGNVVYTEPIEVFVDTTSGFTLSYVADVASSEDWRTDTATLSFTVSGITEWGKSGGYLEYSIDSGTSWQRAESNDYFDVSDETGLSPIFVLQGDQKRSYLFRVRTGAGNVAQAAEPYTFYKDTATLTLAITGKQGEATYAGGENVWASQTVELSFEYTAGVSGAILLITMGEGVEEVSVDPGTGTVTRRIERDCEGYAVKAVLKPNRNPEAPEEQKEAAFTVNLDTVAPQFTLEASADGKAYDGEWTYHEITYTLAITSANISGVTLYYRKAETEAFTKIEGTELTLHEAYKGGLIFKAESGAGKEYVTLEQTVRFDPVAPTVENLRVTNGASMTESEGATWWLAEPLVACELAAKGGVSLLFFEVSVKAEGSAEYGAWERAEGTSYLIRDPSQGGEKGGTKAYYRFRAVNEAGKESEQYYYLTPSVAGEEGSVYVDANTYEVRVVQKLEGSAGEILSDLAAASVNGLFGSDRKRGDLVEFGVEISDYGRGQYYLKEILNTEREYRYAETTSYESGTRRQEGLTVEVRGADVDVEVYLYYLAEITLGNTEQALKGGEITEITIAADLDFPFAGGFEGEIAYGGEREVPQEIGSYPITIECTQPGILFRLAGRTSLTVRYFTETGWSAYSVDSVEDFPYIAIYLEAASGSAEYAYLGVGDSARFVQKADLELDAEIASRWPAIDMTGSYDGDGYRIYANEKLPIDFHIFRTLQGGAITNLGVELSLEGRIEEADASISPLIGMVEGGGIEYSYFVGDISVLSGSAPGARVGGLAGRAANTTFFACFIDLVLEAHMDRGYFGGAVGSASAEEASAFLGLYVIPRIAVTGKENSIGLIAGNSTDGKALIGSGYTEEIFEEMEDALASENPNLDLAISYLSGAAAENGNLVKGLVGNILGESKPFGEWVELAALDLEGFLESAALIGEEFDGGEGTLDSRWEARRVKNLVRLRAQLSGIEGSGTESAPYEVREAKDLESLDTIPYATFKLVNDIDLSSFHTQLGATVPFSGTLYGEGRVLYGYRAEDLAGAGGLFIALAGRVQDLVLSDFVVSVRGEGAYGGILAAKLSGGVLENVGVFDSRLVVRADSGDSESVTVAGGVVGYAESGVELNGVVVEARVEAEGGTVYAGGVAGNARGEVRSMAEVATLATIYATYSYANYAGIAFGYLKLGGSEGATLNAVRDTLYANGAVSSTPYGYNDGALLTVGVNPYADMFGLSEVERFKQYIEERPPFKAGSGTREDPYVIEDQSDLERVNQYLNAHFKLAGNIAVKDFEPIGKGGGVFTGSLDGTGPTAEGRTTYYSISGLEDSLFERLSGTVSHLELNVNYAVRSRIEAGDEVAAYAKVVAPDEDLTFGAVAKTLIGEKALISTVSITANVDIKLSGSGSATVGGVVGRAEGGQIVGVIVSGEIGVNATSASVGGVVGVIHGTEVSAYPELAINMPACNIVVDGASLSVGALVGLQRGEAKVDVETGTNEVTVTRNGVFDADPPMIGKII